MTARNPVNHVYPVKEKGRSLLLQGYKTVQGFGLEFAFAIAVCLINQTHQNQWSDQSFIFPKQVSRA